MAEAALGLLSSIIAVLQLSSKAVEYLSNAKGAHEERGRLLREIVSVTGLLTVLRSKSEAWKFEDWSETVRLVQSPIQQTKELIEKILPKLQPKSGIKKIGKQLIWPFQKGEVLEIIASLERYQRYFLLALQNDHIELSREIKAAVEDVQDSLRDVSAGVKVINEHLIQMGDGIDGIKGELSGTRVDIHEVENSVRRFENAQELRAKKQHRREILQWVSPLNFAAKQKDVFHTKQEGTGVWLLKHPTFQGWLVGKENILFCPGIPGGGKTVLASTVIDFLECNMCDDDTAIAFVYCNYKEAHHTPSNLVGSILQQVATKESSAFPLELPEKLIKLHTEYGVERPPANEFTKILKERLRFFSRVYIVVDALDECSEWEILQDETRSLATDGVKLLITSRPIKGIEDFFSLEARLAISAVDSDVREYLKGQISKKPRLAAHAKKDTELATKIINTIAAKTQGMFLLAQLHINAVGSKHTVKKIRESLECLPQGLDDTYNNAIERIAAQDPEDYALALQVFGWITHARKPLTLSQLQHAIAVEHGMTELNQEDLSDQETLISLCAGLIKFDQRSNYVRLVHYTTHEFFERNGERLFPSAHKRLAVACITYLLFDTFDTFCYTDPDMQQRLKSYPFLEYAASHWGYHARKGGCEDFQDLVRKLLETEGKLDTRFQVVRWKRERGLALAPSRKEEYHCDCNRLLVATWFGLEPFVKKYIEQGLDVNIKNWTGLTLISIAAMRDFESIVRFLLTRKDIQLNTTDRKFGRTPLAWAVMSRGNNTSIVELLLKREDVKPLINVGHRASPLTLAARSGNVNAVKLLLTQNTGSLRLFNRGDFLFPLLAAVENRHMKVALLILQAKSVDPNIRTRTGKTLLVLAIENGDEVFIDILLTLDNINLNKQVKGPSAGASERYTVSPLALAVAKGHTNIVRRLLACGKPINVNVWYGNGPLIFHALDLGQISTVQALLDHPDFAIDRNMMDNHCRPLLNCMLARAFGGPEGPQSICSDREQYAQLARKVLTLQLGLHGASTREQDVTLKFKWKYQQYHFHHLVDIFLSLEGINPDWRDQCGMTLMCQAAADGRAEIVALLLARSGVDPNLPSSCSTPLAWACIYGHLEVVQLLIDRPEVIIDSHDAELRTPFSWAARNGHEKIVELLLARGCEVDTQDKEGQTPLSRAQEKGHDGVVKKILYKSGVDSGFPAA